MEQHKDLGHQAAPSGPVPSALTVDAPAYSDRVKCKSCEHGAGLNGCTDCLNTGHDPQAFAGGIDEALNDAYAEGRKDQSEEDGELLRWAYSKLHHVSFTKQDDALMLDRFKLLLEHGVSA